MIILKRFYTYIGHLRELSLRLCVILGRAIARFFFFSPKEVLQKYPLPHSEDYQKWPIRKDVEERGKCQSCLQCVKGCPTQAILAEDGELFLSYEICLRCGVCAEICPAQLIDLGRADLLTVQTAEKVRKILL